MGGSNCLKSQVRKGVSQHFLTVKRKRGQSVHMCKLLLKTLSFFARSIVPFHLVENLIQELLDRPDGNGSAIGIV